MDWARQVTTIEPLEQLGDVPEPLMVAFREQMLRKITEAFGGRSAQTEDTLTIDTLLRPHQARAARLCSCTCGCCKIILT